MKTANVVKNDWNEILIIVDSKIQKKNEEEKKIRDKKGFRQLQQNLKSKILSVEREKLSRCMCGTH